MVSFCYNDFINMLLMLYIIGSQTAEVLRPHSLLPGFSLIFLYLQKWSRFKVSNSRRTTLREIFAWYDFTVNETENRYFPIKSSCHLIILILHTRWCPLHGYNLLDRHGICYIKIKYKLKRHSQEGDRDKDLFKYQLKTEPVKEN